MNDKEHPARTTAVGMDRKLTAILAADVQGYSRLMGEDEVGTLRTLTAYRQITDVLIEQHRGRIVGTAGDSILAEFASVVDAVQCALVIQTTLKAENANRPDDRRMEFRIGINLGDVMVEGEQIYGDGVNIAARLEALAEGGGICISGTVHEQIENKLALAYEDLGEQTVKNIKKPVRVYRVRLEVPSPLVGEGQGEGAAGKAGSSKFQVPGSTLKEKNPKPRRVSTAQFSRPTLVIAGVLITGALVTLLYSSLSPLHISQSEIRNQEALPLPDKPSIAVLPFTNISSDPEQEYFSDGITEELIASLSQLSEVFVISRNSAFFYKGKAVKIPDVSKELGVKYVLEGSVRKAGDQVRITVQWIDAATDHHLWSERYDRPLKDIFALQDEIVQKIVTTLKLQLPLREQRVLERKTTDNIEAYDYFLRGAEYTWRFTKETNFQARQMLEKAIEVDPQYALAYAYLGWTYLNSWIFQWSPEPQTLEQAFALAQKALALNDSLPEAYFFLSNVSLFKQQHEEAVTAAERCIALAPGRGECYWILANVLSFAGRPAEAIALAEKSLRLDPLAPVNSFVILGNAYRLMGQYEKAIAAYNEALRHAPNFPFAHAGLAAVYSETGREEEAKAEAAEVLRLNPSFSLEGTKERRPYKDPAQTERLLATLRKAGLK